MTIEEIITDAFNKGWNASHECATDFDYQYALNGCLSELEGEIKNFSVDLIPKTEIMKNILGHDNESEVITIIARLREKNINLISYNDSSIECEIVLTYRITVPVPNTTTQKIQYTINKIFDGDSCAFYLKQLNGIDDRLIPFSDGYIIWGLLEELVVV